jgi:tRNA-binding EMAP/Myf-like protein
MTLDRAAMLRFGIPNIHLLFEGDVRVLVSSDARPARVARRVGGRPGRRRDRGGADPRRLEVESIERIGPDLSGIRVGHVVERAKHPNADRLSLCRVDLGDGAPVEIVCGAPNVAAGQKVAVASPGARCPTAAARAGEDPRRRVAGDDLLGRRARAVGESEGILVLDPAAPVGAPLDR